jgi:hypothetical protein
MVKHLFDITLDPDVGVRVCPVTASS